MKKIIVLFYIISFTQLFGQSEDAKTQILDIMSKMENVPEYNCEVKIKIDVKFIKIKERTGKMYYSSPTEIDYKINGFAFLPKKEMTATSSELFKKDFIAIDLGNELVNNQDCDVIRVIPMDIESEISTGQFWVNKENLIHKMTIITKDKGSYDALFEYGDIKYDLPKKIIMLFDVKDQKIPALLSGDLESFSEQKDKETNEISKGKITIDYSNHRFN